MKDTYIDPDRVNDVTQLDYKVLCWRFIGRNRRLQKFVELNAPEIIVNSEKCLIQKDYNEMRMKCLSDVNYPYTKDVGACNVKGTKY